MFSLLIFSFVAETTFVHSLKLNNSFAGEENFIMERVNSMIQLCDPTCVIAESHDLLDTISKEFSVKRNLILICGKSFNNMFKQCNNVLFFDVPSASVCDQLRKEKRLYSGSKQNLVLSYLRLPADLTALQTCLSSFGLAVVKVLLQSGTVFVLNTQRQFVPLETFNNPPFLARLQGKRLGVATFHFPPFSIITENNNNVGE